jgi:hypothetical protein
MTLVQKSRARSRRRRTPSRACARNTIATVNVQGLAAVLSSIQAFYARMSSLI